MAEVTGEIGGQPVELYNAATEATLKQLLAQIKMMSQKMGITAKQQADAEKEMEKFYKQLDKSNQGLKDARKKRDDETKAIEEASKARAKEDALRQRTAMVTGKLMQGLEGAANGLMNLVGKVTATMSSVANMGNSFAAAGGVFNNIPIVGGMLGSIFGAIGAAGDKVVNTFRQAGQVGANFGGSINALVNNASRAGLTMEQFSQMINKNSEGLALLGGNTTEGAKRVVNFTQALKKSGVQDDLARLGMNAEDIANGMASISGRLARAGLTRGMSDAQIAKVSGEYLKNLDAVSRLTGKNKEALQQEADARMADSQYRLMLAKLDPEGAANLEALMASIPKEHQAGLKEILATGNAVSDQAQAAMYYMNKTGQNAMQLGSAMRASGTLTKDQMYAFDAARKEEARVLAEQAKQGKGVISTLGMYGDSVQQAMTVGILNAAQEKTLQETKTQQEAELAKQRKGQVDSLDPAKLVEAQKTLAATSNEFTMMLARYLPTLMGAFQELIGFIRKYVLPAFEFIMQHWKELTIAIFGVIAVMKILRGVAATMEFINNFRNLGRQPGSKGNPMYTISADGPGGVGDLLDKDKKKGGKRPGKPSSGWRSIGGGLKDVDLNIGDKLKGLGETLKSSKNLVKGLGAVGAVASGAMLVSEMSDINAKEKSGEITKAQATEMKGGAVGSAAGGAGGALAGAAAGAAIGSVVPVIGTAIGGLIGAAIGGWAGSKGGEVIGGEIAKSGLIEKAGASITDAWTATTGFIGTGFTNVKNAISEKLPGIKEGLGSLVTGITDKIPGIKEGLSNLAGSIKDKISETLPAIKEGFGKFTDSIGSVFNSMKEKFAETFPAVTEGLRKVADGVKKSAEYVTEKASQGANYVKEGVKNTYNKMFGNKSGPAGSTTPAAPKPASPSGAATPNTPAPAPVVGTSPQGTGVNYGAKPEDVLRGFAKAQGVIKDPNKPTTATTTASIETIEQRKAREDAAKKAKQDQDKKTKEENERKERENRQPQQNAPAQEMPGTQLASLNKTMSDLLKTNKELVALNERQLAVQRKITGDVLVV